MSNRDLYLVVHEVEGLEPGAYYLSTAKRKLELLRAGPVTRETAKLFVEGNGAAGRVSLGAVALGKAA